MTNIGQILVRCQQELAQTSAGDIDALHGAYHVAIRSYPVDCPAKQLLAKALKRCTRISLIEFIMASNLALNEGLPLSEAITDCLKDEAGQPIFSALCEEAKGAKHEPFDQARHDKRFSRRQFIKRGVAAGLGGGVALDSYSVLGGKRPKGETMVSALKRDGFHLGRLALEVPFVFGAIDAAISDTKRPVKDEIDRVIEALNPIVEQQMGLPVSGGPAPADKPPGLGR